MDIVAVFIAAATVDIKVDANPNYSFRVNSGFTIIELLIALIIICILAFTVYPSYSHHLTTVRRVNVAAVLVDLAGRMEQFYIKDHSYKDATLEKLGIHNSDQIGYQNYYQITIDAAVDSYFLKATPIGAQARLDKTCGALGLDHQGNKSISGVGIISKCWQ